MLPFLLLRKNLTVFPRAGKELAVWELVVSFAFLYNKNQKDVELTNENGERTKAPILEQDRSPVPFINVGLSYSLFK